MAERKARATARFLLSTSYFLLSAFCFLLLEAEDAGYGEAVIAFASYGLDGGGGEARVGGEELEEAANALDVGVGGGGVDDFSVADDVVGKEKGAGTGELEGGGEVKGIAVFVGVEEDEVEGFGLLGVQLGEGVERGAEAELDGVGEAGVGDVGESDLGVMGIELEGDELAAGGKGSGEVDGAVAAEGSDLEDAVGALGFGEELQELALAGGDVDGGEAGGGVGFERGFEDGVGRDKEGVEVVVDGGPEGFGFEGGGFRWGHAGASEGSYRLKRRILKIVMMGKKKIWMT
jgi:hypothetical protein